MNDHLHIFHSSHIFIWFKAFPLKVTTTKMSLLYQIQVEPEPEKCTHRAPEAEAKGGNGPCFWFVSPDSIDCLHRDAMVVSPVLTKRSQSRHLPISLLAAEKGSLSSYLTCVIHTEVNVAMK